MKNPSIGVPAATVRARFQAKHQNRTAETKRSGGLVRLVFIRFDGNAPGTAIAIEVGRSIGNGTATTRRLPGALPD